MANEACFPYNDNSKGVNNMPQTASPFRYPGGKSQLYPFIVNLLSLNNINGTYIEPFAGGAGVAIKLLLNNKVSKIWINDYDKAIYSTWFHILNDPIKMIEMINSVPFDYNGGHTYNKTASINFWKQEKEIYTIQKDQKDSLELAFATLFLNRTNRSGIISGGPIGGMNQENQTQIYARFNKKTLSQKINRISQLKDKIRLTNYDALDLINLIQRESSPDNTFIFFDPPYFKQGSGLYFTSFNNEGHKTLAKKIVKLKDRYWITTYDVDPHIIEYFKNNKKKYSYELKYSANNKRRGKAPELLFASPNLKIESYNNVHLATI